MTDTAAAYGMGGWPFWAVIVGLFVVVMGRSHLSYWLGRGVFTGATRLAAADQVLGADNAAVAPRPGRAEESAGDSDPAESARAVSSEHTAGSAGPGGTARTVGPAAIARTSAVGGTSAVVGTSAVARTSAMVGTAGTPGAGAAPARVTVPDPEATGRGAAARARVARLMRTPTARRGLALVHRWGPLAVTMAYLTVGLQTAVFVGSGLVRMPYLRFTIASVPGSIAWAFVWGTVGLGAVWAAARLATASPWALAGTVVVATVLVTWLGAATPGSNRFRGVGRGLHDELV